MGDRRTPSQSFFLVRHSVPTKLQGSPIVVCPPLLKREKEWACVVAHNDADAQAQEFSSRADEIRRSGYFVIDRCM